MILAWTPVRGPLVRKGGGHRPWCESWLNMTSGTSSFLSLSFPVCKVVDVRDCFGKFCKDLEIRYAKHQQSASVSGTRCVPGAVSDHSPGVDQGTRGPPDLPALFPAVSLKRGAPGPACPYTRGHAGAAVLSLKLSEFPAPGPLEGQMLVCWPVASPSCGPGVWR